MHRQFQPTVLPNNPARQWHRCTTVQIKVDPTIETAQIPIEAVKILLLFI